MIRRAGRAALRLLRPASAPALFPDYASAAAACAGGGYESGDLVQVVVEKTERYRRRLAGGATLEVAPHQMASLIAVAAAGRANGAVHVLDFGGAAGAHYFLARRVLDPPRPWRWCVVETPVTARAAGALASETLHFHTSVEDARSCLGTVDFVHACGALQCVPAPHELLARLLSCRPRLLFLGRLAMTDGEADLVTIHRSRLRDNGPGPLPEGFRDRECPYPYTILSRRRLDEAVERDYRVEWRLADPSGLIPVPGRRLVGEALLARRQGT